MKWKFWERLLRASERLDLFHVLMFEEAMRLERARNKRKRTYEV